MGCGGIRRGRAPPPRRSRARPRPCRPSYHPRERHRALQHRGDADRGEAAAPKRAVHAVRSASPRAKHDRDASPSACPPRHPPSAPPSVRRVAYTSEKVPSPATASSACSRHSARERHAVRRRADGPAVKHPRNVEASASASASNDDPSPPTGRSLWRTSSAALARSPGDPRLTDWLFRRYDSRFLRLAARRRSLRLASDAFGFGLGLLRRRRVRRVVDVHVPPRVVVPRAGSARRSLCRRGRVVRVPSPARDRDRTRDVGSVRARVHHRGVVADGFLPTRAAALASSVAASVDRPPLASAASNLASSSEATLAWAVVGTSSSRGAAGVCWTTTDASSLDRSGRLGNGGGLFGRGSRGDRRRPRVPAFGAAGGTSTASSKEKVTWSSRLAAAVDVAALAASCAR